MSARASPDQRGQEGVRCSRADVRSFNDDAAGYTLVLGGPIIGLASGSLEWWTQSDWRLTTTSMLAAFGVEWQLFD